MYGVDRVKYQRGSAVTIATMRPSVAQLVFMCRSAADGRCQMGLPAQLSRD